MTDRNRVISCDEARQRWLRVVDERVEDAFASEHMTTCAACRQYAESMSKLIDGLHALKEATAEVHLSETSRVGTRCEARPRALGFRAMRIAAMIAIVVGAVPITRQMLRPPGGDHSTQDHGPLLADGLSDASDSPKNSAAIAANSGVAGDASATKSFASLTLNGDSERRFVPVAQEVGDSQVEVIWLYPTRQPATVSQ